MSEQTILTKKYPIYHSEEEILNNVNHYTRCNNCRSIKYYPVVLRDVDVVTCTNKNCKFKNYFLKAVQSFNDWFVRNYAPQNNPQRIEEKIIKIRVGEEEFTE